MCNVLIFSDWTIELNHPTEGLHTASNTIAENLVFTGTKEDKQEFIRALLDVTFLFQGDDYDYIKAIKDGADPCEETTITVSTTGYSWEGLLPITNAKYNDDLKNVSIKPILNDRYRCFNDKWEDSFSIFGATTALEVSFFQGEIERERKNFLSLPDINTPPEPTNDPTDPNWQIFETEASYNVLSMDWSGFVTYVRQVTTTTCSMGSPVAPAGSGWSLRVDDCAGTGTATYSKKAPLVLDPNERYVDEDDEKHIFYIVPGYNATDEIALTMDNGRSLTQVLQSQLTPCGLTLVSDFLTVNEPGTAPSNDVYDQKANVANLIIFQRSDVKNPDAFQNATKAETTLKDIIESLVVTFDVFWWIDADDNFRIEHVSAKSTSEYLDLSSIYADELRGTNIYETSQGDYPRRQKYAWDESYNNRDFDGRDITYSNACSDGSETFQAKWSTDVNSIYSTDEASNAGFVLVAAVVDGSDYYIPSEEGVLTGEEIINGHLAWSNLHPTYHTYNRPFATGTMNGSAKTFDSVKKSTKQVVSVNRFSIADFAALVSRLENPTLDSAMTTPVGTGEVQSFSYDVKNQTLTLTLNHA